MDWSPYATGGAASRDDSFTGLEPEFAANVYRLLQDARAAGYPLQVTSAYRSPELQAILYKNAIKKYGSPEAARKWVAPPGRSQHNFGRAVDLALNNALLRDANSPAARWVKENAQAYGVAVPMSWEPWQLEPIGARSKPYTPSASQPRISTQGAAPMDAQQAPQQPRGLLGLFGPREDDPRSPAERRRDILSNLAIGLSGLSMFPNTAMINALQGGIQERRETRKEAAARSRTAAWLASQGATTLANGVSSGAIPGGTALSMYQAQMARAQAAANDPSVQSSQLLPDSSGVVLVLRDGSVQVKTVSGETLSGQEAIDYVRAAQAAGVGIQGERSRARATGGLEAEIGLGAAAAGSRVSGQEQAKRAFQALDELTKVSQSIVTIDEALAALDEGAQSGYVYNLLPNVTASSASLKNAMDRMGLDVISSVTFGALSEAEMQLAMETAVPRNLGPEDLRVWLMRKREAQVKAQEALRNAARFLSDTRNSLSEYLDQLAAPPAAPVAPAATPPAQPTRRLRFNPTTGGVDE